MNTWLNSLKHRFAREVESPSSLAVPAVSPASDRARLSRPEQKPKVPGSVIEGLFFGLGLLFFASLLLGLLAFTRPLWQAVPVNLLYQQSGAYSYRAPAPLGVYDTGTLVSGEPIFPKLNCQVTLDFKYLLAGDQVQIQTGTHQLTAQIGEDLSGWQRTVPLEQETAFSGNTFTSSVLLDVCQAEDMAASLENETDLHPSVYSLVIHPQIQVSGTASGKAFRDTFNPSLKFQFDKLHVYVFQDDPKVDPLNPTSPGLIKTTQTAANTLPLFGLKPEVSALRKAASLGLGFSLAGLLWLGLSLYLTTRRSQESYLQLKYGSLLVDVQSQALEAALPAVDVLSMDDLAKLAERNSTMILHESRGAIHSYFVQGDRIVYRYTLDEQGSLPQVISPLQEEEQKLRRGFERGEFQVYYQPIVSLPEGRINTVEALLRWQQPGGDLISAAEFIRAAEETGLIDTIGEWMLQVAITQLKQWQDAGNQIKLAVNLSHRQLVQGDPAESILRLLKKTGMDPQLLQIEVSESSLREGAQGVLSSLKKLKDVGVQIALDGFSNQSALSSLGGYPVHSIKIDRQCIQNISDPENAAVVSAILREAENLGLNVVAEGVETEQELDFLRSKLCPLAQGYLLGRPAPAAALTQLLLEGQNTSSPKPPRRRRPAKEKTP